MEEIWSSSSNDEHEEATGEQVPPTSGPIWQLLYFLLIWQSVYRVSNEAMNALLKFISVFVRVMGRAFTTGNIIPNTVSRARSYLQNTENDDFTQYVVCPKCDSIYEYNDCVVVSQGRKQSKLCKHIAYPNHPIICRRQECGAQLLKSIRSGKSYRLEPIKAYPYQSLQHSFSYLVKRDGFLSACEQWRYRMSSIPSSHLGDVYDGRIWHSFSSFLESPHCYILTMNVDWFQPFTRTQYSVGAIYLTVQNLPRSQRYKDENVILAGIIPGSSEPSLTMNSYLAPLVRELQQSWDIGLTVRTSTNMPIKIRLALACVACDIPASIKVCGFLSHNAAFGCKCYKKFPVQQCKTS